LIKVSYAAGLRLKSVLLFKVIFREMIQYLLKMLAKIAKLFPNPINLNKIGISVKLGRCESGSVTEKNSYPFPFLRMLLFLPVSR